MFYPFKMPRKVFYTYTKLTLTASDGSSPVYMFSTTEILKLRILGVYSTKQLNV